MLKYILCILTVLCSRPLCAGFVVGTQVKTESAFISIENISVGQTIECCLDGHINRVTHTTASLEKKCIVLVLQGSSTPLICSYHQRFYAPRETSWIEAKDLQPNQFLINNKSELVTIKSVQILDNETELFDISIANCHTFFVSDDAILTHNLTIPVASINVVSIGCGGGAVGSFLGPIGIVGGIVIGGLIGIGVKACFKKRYDECNGTLEISETSSDALKNASDIEGKEKSKDESDDAQVPGKPTEKDGFIPKKNWDGKKVKHPRGWGWPDKKGNIWIPSGPKGHGGPHWDVQKPGRSKDYANVVPGGKIRGKK